MDPLDFDRLKLAASRQPALWGHDAQRLLHQLEFARSFLDLADEDRRESWAGLIDQATHALADAIEDGSYEGICRARKEGEQVLAPIGQAAKEYTIHLVAHAHIDMNWQWSWLETVSTVNDTFTTLLGLMEEFPELHFTQSQASVYEIVQKYCPDLARPIAEHIAAGRWEVAAVHWVEGDKNMVCGESLARHLLATRTFMQETYDLSPEETCLDWEPDTFGHAATVPSIVSRGGVRRYYLCRGGRKDLPVVFWWKGPDGRRILVNRESSWYNDRIGPQIAPAMVRFATQTGMKNWMCVFGIGDHGGGPTRADLLRAREMNDWPIWPTLTFDTTRRFYDLLEQGGDRWPEIEGELNFEFPGCYTSQSDIKRTNRRSEELCQLAERVSVLAGGTGYTPIPAGGIERSWKRTLFAHFHDILPGSCTSEPREHHLGQFQETKAETGMVAMHGLRSIARQVDTSFAGPEKPVPPLSIWVDNPQAGGFGAGVEEFTAGGAPTAWPRAVVVFNPTPSPVRSVATLGIYESGFWPGPHNLDRMRFVVRTPQGHVIPTQRVDQGSWLGHKYVTVAFPVEIGAMGYRSFAVEPCGEFNDNPTVGYPGTSPTADVPGFSPGVTRDGLTLENEFVRVRFDSLTGGIVSLVDKSSGRETADPENPMGLVEYVVERAGGMSSWTVHPLRECRCPLEMESFGPGAMPGTSIGKPATGPHVAVMRGVMHVERSRVEIAYILRAANPCLEVDIRVDWLETGSSEKGIPGLRLRLPMGLGGADRAHYEIPYGSVTRSPSDRQWVPTLRWVNVNGQAAGGGKAGPAGLAILNDSTHGYQFDGKTVRANLLRSSYNPDPLPELGAHHWRFGLIPHDGRLADAQLRAAADAFTQPLRLVNVPSRDGTLPSAADGLTVEGEGVAVITLKPAEDGQGAVVRLVETTGDDRTVTVTTDGKLLACPSGAVEVDLLERPVETNRAEPVEGGFRISLSAREIVSVKLTF